jgi:hypothetical protein
MKRIFINAAVALLVLSGCRSGNTGIISDDFEYDSLGEIWSDDKFLPGALSFVTENKRSGNKAVMLTLNPGDQIEEEIGTILERAELKEAKSLFSVEDNSYEYAFSLFIPADFPIVPTRLVIAQWKQNCKSGNCDPDNPVLAIRYVMGELFVTLQTEPEKKVLFSRIENIKGQWLDLKFRTRFSRTENGVIKAWINDEQVIDYKGITAYKEKYGYPYPGVYYFKMGLYRDHVEVPMTIYIDSYSKGEVREP